MSLPELPELPVNYEDDEYYEDEAKQNAIPELPDMTESQIPEIPEYDDTSPVGVDDDTSPLGIDDDTSPVGVDDDTSLPGIDDIEEVNFPETEESCESDNNGEDEEKGEISSKKRKRPIIPKSEYDEDGNPLLTIPDLNDINLFDEIDKYLGAEEED